MTPYLRGKEGLLVGDTQIMLNRFAQYFEELLNETEQNKI